MLIVLSSLDLFIGFIFAVVSFPLITGSVQRNDSYGVRNKGTLASDEVWYPVNRFAGKVMLIYGIVLFLLGLAGVIMDLNKIPIPIPLRFIIGFGPLWVMLSMVHVDTYQRKHFPEDQVIAKEKADDAATPDTQRS